MNTYVSIFFGFILFYLQGIASLEKISKTMTESVSVTDNSFETTAVKLLQRFHLLQQERVETYTLFEEYGFS